MKKMKTLLRNIYIYVCVYIEIYKIQTGQKNGEKRRGKK